MNILPHKSWNVWNRDNREKVENDVKAHKEEEEKKRKRVQEIEQEVRYNQLKDRAKKRREDIGTEVLDQYSSIPSSSTALIPSTEELSKPNEIKHINFFEDIEKGLGPLTSVDKNPEIEAEKKVQQQRDKVSNSLNPKQQPTSDFEVPTPWYSKGENAPSLAEDKLKKDQMYKDLDDPLLAMNKYLKQKTQSKVSTKEKQKEDSKKQAMDKLRQQRLQREQEEKRKLAEIMHKRTPSKTSHR